MSTDVVQQARVWCDKQQSYEPSYLSGPAVIACVRALAEMVEGCERCAGSGRAWEHRQHGNGPGVTYSLGPCCACCTARLALAKLVNERSEA